MAEHGTYVYCVVAAPRAPAMKVRRGLAGTGPVRLLDVDRGLFAVVCDAPLARYGEEAISRGLSDLEWVSRAAIAHEAVVESFIEAPAVLPMKLFTLFTSDERARDHVRGQRQRIATLVKRVTNHHEFGVRIILEGQKPAQEKSVASGRAGRAGGARGAGGEESGASFLSRKKAQRDASVELRERARATVADVFDRLAAKARLSRRRAPGELPMQGGPLLLDAAFLVPRTRSAAFIRLVTREARDLKTQGYGLTLTGPWPPYTFVQD